MVSTLGLDIFSWKLLMEQSFANENITSGNNEIIKVCVNDVILEEKSKGNPSVQTKTRRNPKNWHWTTKNFDLENIQMMHCMLCYQNLVIRINPRTQMRKGLIFYYKKNRIFKNKKMWM